MQVSVTETALSDGRQITLAFQISGVFATVAGVSLEDDPSQVAGDIILGIGYQPHRADQPDLVTSGISKVG